MSNPLLSNNLHPDYPSIQADHIEPAIEALLNQAKTSLNNISNQDFTLGWDAIMTPLDEALDALSRCWGLVGHLNAVMDEPKWRAAFNKMLPKVTNFYTELEQDQALFQCFKTLRESIPESLVLDLSAQRRRSLELAIRDFRLSGAELAPDQRAQLAKLIQSLSERGQKFSEHVLDAMNASEWYVEDEAGLSGLPEDVIEAASLAAKQSNRLGWRFTPHIPSYLPVMQYAHDRNFRQTMYRMYSTLASDQGDEAFDNGPIMQDILKDRQESAKLLGFEDFVAMSLAPKMAASGDKVRDFLADLVHRVKPLAQKEFAELEQFASTQLGLTKLEAWDLPYVTQQLKQRQFQFTDQDIKVYFQLDRVLEGLFKLINELFGYRFVETELPKWHNDVRCYAIYADAAQMPRAYVYLDLYARPGKRSGAWMNVASNRRMAKETMTEPMAWLTCNFQAPVGSRPALLTHDEVTTLFHEFGHGLHHVLTDMQEPRVSGLNGVEWDAVELPSQFLENFAWEWETIRAMSSHYETGEPMPDELFRRLLSARHFMMGLYLLRQLEFALFDLDIHRQVQGTQPIDIMDILNEVRREVAVVRYPAWNRFPYAFSHIFAGGYAAGYYSYLWAEVLSADCYLAFTEVKDGDRQPVEKSQRRDLGRKFLQEVLSLGSVRPSMDHFKAFMQREPQLEALLEVYGLSQDDEHEVEHVIA